MKRSGFARRRPPDLLLALSCSGLFQHAFAASAASDFSPGLKPTSKLKRR
jgi:hypothetical protein